MGVFLQMLNRFILLILFFACAHPPEIQFDPPPLKSYEFQSEPSPLDQGLLTEYDIWEFLKSKPGEREVLETMGFPDSVWVSDEESYYILYYYRPDLNDYNSIELHKSERKVIGYEWDE